MPQIAVLSRDPSAGPVREGGRARRAGLIAGLEDAAVHHLAVSCQGSSDTLEGRLYPYFKALAQGLAVAGHTEAPRLLVFYPELPGAHPPRSWKLPLVFAWLAVLRWLCTARGIRLLVDVGDIPRWQHPTLKLPVAMRSGLHRLLEMVLFGLADRVTVATPELAAALARDLGVPRDRFAEVPNAASSDVLTRERAGAESRATDPLRVTYVGNLEARQDRGIRAMCRAFVTKAPRRSELVLMGEGGDWIALEFPDPRVVVLPPQPEDACAAWLARSDFAVIPYPTHGYYRTVSPMKLPLYALARVPIISTPLEATKRVIAEHGLGECVDLDAAFADLEGLARRYRDFRGGRNLSAFTWESSARRLLEA